MIKSQPKSYSFSVPRFSSQRISLGALRPVLRNRNFHEIQNELVNLNGEIQTTNATLDFLTDMDYFWFCDIRYIGTATVLKEFSNILKIIEHKLKIDLNHKKVSKGIFSWRMDDFLNRKYVQYLLDLKQAKITGGKDIDMIKLMADIDTIIDCCMKFYSDLVKQTNFTGESIRDIINLIRLEALILQNEKYHEVTLNMIRYKLKNFNIMKTLEMQRTEESREEYLNTHFADMLIKFPIEYRYNIKYDYARIRLLRKQKDIAEEVYFTQIDYYNDKYISEQKSFNLIVSAYEIQIERLNEELNYWNNKYTKEYEQYDLQISRNSAELEEILYEYKRRKQIYEKNKRSIEIHLAKAKKDDDLNKFNLRQKGKGKPEEEIPSKHKKGRGKGKAKRKGKGKGTEKTEEDLEKPKKEAEHTKNETKRKKKN